MEKLYETKNKVRKVSNKRPTALILPIPATIRDVMNFEHGSEVKWELCVENDCRIVKIYNAKD
jgi:hypothetical protein